MRSIEYLIQLYPEKTGKELLAIQAEDKAEDEREFRKAHKADLDFAEDINKNGGYFKYKAGGQHGFYKVTNMRMEGGALYMDVESIVLFDGPTRDGLSLEHRTSEFQKEDRYMLRTSVNRVRKSEWDELYTKIYSIKNLWSDIKSR